MSPGRRLEIGDRVRITAPGDSTYLGRVGTVESIQRDLVAVLLDGPPPDGLFDPLPKQYAELKRGLVGIGIFVGLDDVERVEATAGTAES